MISKFSLLLSFSLLELLSFVDTIIIIIMIVINNTVTVASPIIINNFFFFSLSPLFKPVNSELNSFSVLYSSLSSISFKIIIY